jgi:hypothetical protein
LSNRFQAATVFSLTALAVAQAHGQSLISPNGYSGIGLIPSARTLHSSEAVIDYSKALPGARASRGHNFQVGFGLTDNFELVGKLATQNLNCNMFAAGACPPDTIRDFSASVKWRLASDWLDAQNAALAVGATDVGGAAVRFKSYYAVGTKTIDNVDFHAGVAQAKGDLAILQGSFAGVDINPNSWSKISLQTIGSNSWAHAALLSPITVGGVSASATFSARLNNNALSPKEWFGVAFNIPLDGVTPAGMPDRTKTTRLVRSIDPASLRQELERHGFFRPVITEESGLIQVTVNNTAYLWNALDAAGVALGVIVGAYGDSARPFELTIATRGIPVLRVSGTASCAKEWLNTGKSCGDLEVYSLLTRHEDSKRSKVGIPWHFRPELAISPVITSAVGTEFGALDFDIGAGLNAIVPLWKGAIWDINRIEPLNIITDDFRKEGIYYNSRLRSTINRRMLHQLISAPSLNTQLRLSVGTAYTTWSGQQLETLTQSNDGRHRLGVQLGQFEHESLSHKYVRDYHLISYRISNNAHHSLATEIVYGKFWMGDKGYKIGQRFWHGDTAIELYLRRTQMQDGSPSVSFAGIQFSIPMTPRRNISSEYFGARGVNQWVYTIESRIGKQTNFLNTGYGEIPRVGETVQQTFNRDRSGSDYYRADLMRARNAFQAVTLE